MLFQLQPTICQRTVQIFFSNKMIIGNNETVGTL
jgi:hypothetical protein